METELLDSRAGKDLEFDFSADEAFGAGETARGSGLHLQSSRLGEK